MKNKGKRGVWVCVCVYTGGKVPHNITGGDPGYIKKIKSIKKAMEEMREFESK